MFIRDFLIKSCTSLAVDQAVKSYNPPLGFIIIPLAKSIFFKMKGEKAVASLVISSAVPLCNGGLKLSKGAIHAAPSLLSGSLFVARCGATGVGIILKGICFLSRELL